MSTELLPSEYSLRASFLEGVGSGLGSIAQAELAEDATHVVPGCLLADDQPRGDFGIREAFPEEGEHLSLPAREIATIAPGGTALGTQ